MRWQRILWTGVSALLLAMFLVAFWPHDLAYAQSSPDDPDTLTLNSAEAFRDLLETGDLLIVLHYTIAYSTLPDDSADINFIFRLLDSGGNVIGTNTPYPYNDQGYGQGAASIYLSQAETEAQGFTDANGAWASWPISGLRVELDGNPTIFTTPPNTDINLSTGAFSSGSGSATNKALLATEVLRIASILQGAWQVTLLTDTGKLSESQGAPYFILAIPGLRQMAPAAFSIITTSPTFPTPIPTPGGAGTLAGESATRFDSQFWINGAFDRLADDANLPRGLPQGILVFSGVMLFAGIMAAKFGPGGAGVALGLSAMVVLPVSMWGGFADWASGALVIAGLGSFGILRMFREHG